MKLKDFKSLLQGTRLGEQGGERRVLALRLHLVGELTVAEAARRAKISRQAVYDALEKLPRKRCKACGHWL